MGAREITNRGTKKNIGKFPSLKMGRIIWYESLLERDYIYLLEFDSDVVAYYEQPCRIHYIYQGKSHCYTPDLHVLKNDRRLIVEVKPEKKVYDEKNALLFLIASQICREQDYELVVVTDEMIRGQRLTNIKLLYKYARTQIFPQHQILCQKFFASAEEAALGEFIQFFASQNTELQVVYAFIYWGVIVVDLKQPISLNSIVRLPMSAPVARKVS